MPKTTQKARCEKFGITRAMLQAAKNKGVNIWNDAEMETHLAGRRHRLKPDAKLSKDSAAIDPDSDDDLASIRDKLMRATTLEDVKILKEKAAGVRQTLAAEKESGDAISLKEAKEGVIRIVSGLKARLLKIPSDAAPRVEGLTASKAEKVMREELVKALEELASDGEKLFED